MCACDVHRQWGKSAPGPPALARRYRRAPTPLPASCCGQWVPGETLRGLHRLMGLAGVSKWPLLLCLDRLSRSWRRPCRARDRSLSGLDERGRGSIDIRSLYTFWVLKRLELLRTCPRPRPRPYSLTPSPAASCPPCSCSCAHAALPLPLPGAAFPERRVRFHTLSSAHIECGLRHITTVTIIPGYSTVYSHPPSLRAGKALHAIHELARPVWSILLDASLSPASVPPSSSRRQAAGAQAQVTRAGTRQTATPLQPHGHTLGMVVLY